MRGLKLKVLPPHRAWVTEARQKLTPHPSIRHIWYIYHLSVTMRNPTMHCFPRHVKPIFVNRKPNPDRRYHSNRDCAFCSGQAHQGSCYGAYKDVQMAYHRAEHVRSRIQELRAEQHLHQQQQQRLSHMASGDSITHSFSMAEGQHPPQMGQHPPQMGQHPPQMGFTHTDQPMQLN